jgi:hypothetical protein
MLTLEERDWATFFHSHTEASISCRSVSYAAYHQCFEHTKMYLYDHQPLYSHGLLYLTDKNKTSQSCVFSKHYITSIPSGFWVFRLRLSPGILEKAHKEIQFLKHCVLYDTRWSTKSRNPVILSVIHHRWNPWKSTSVNPALYVHMFVALVRK